MGKFIFLYYNGGDPSQTPKDEMEQIMSDWAAWFKKMGPAIVDGGAPLGPDGQAVNAQGAQAVDEWPATGYTIIEAADMAEATKHAQEHPMHKHTDGKAVIRVYEALPM